MSAAKLREKLAQLRDGRRELGLEMELAARAPGGIDAPAAERFKRRHEHFELWIAHFRAELAKATED